MLSAVAQIGNYIITKEGKSLGNPLSILVENPNANGKYNKILKITFDYNNLNYIGVFNDDFDSSKILKLIYKKSRGANAPDLSPTSKITEIDKTFKKIINSVSAVKKHKKYKDSKFIEKLENSLKNNKDKILNDLKNKKENTETILTITFKDNNTNKEYYVGDIEEFKDYLIYNATIDYYHIKTGNINSKGNGICSICNEENEVYGLFGKFKFYTVDKIGNVNNFNQNESWKTFPICLKCALSIEEGKKYLEENLRYKFYGNDFYLVPNTLFNKDLGNVLQRYNDLAKLIGNIKEKENIKDYSRKEESLFRFLGNNNIYCYNTLMFFKEGNDFKITQMIEGIYPLRFKELYNKIKETENKPIFKIYKMNINVKKLNKKQREYFTSIFNNKEDLESLKFLFGYIKEFVNNDNKIFLDFVNNIFTNKKIDYYYLINNFITKIQSEFSNNQNIRLLTYKSFITLYFLINLDLLNNYTYNTVNNISNTTNTKNGDNILENEKLIYGYNETDKFFDEYGEFFNNDAKKAIFLTGVLVDKLLSLQYAKRNSKPFMAKIHGLKLDKNKVENIFKEATQKLMEYEQEEGYRYYNELRKEIAKKFLESGNNWNLTNNEISYVFSLGMATSSLFGNATNENNESNENKDNN